MSDITMNEAGTPAEQAKPAPRRKRPWPRRSRRGMGLPGMVLTLVLAAIILGATFVIFNQSNTNFRTQEALTRVGLVESELRRSYANAPVYDSGKLDEIVRRAMPRNALQGAAGSEIIVTPWGGQITAGAGATPGTTSSSSPNRFWIRVQGLPSSACQAIAEAHLNSSGVVSVHVRDRTGNNLGTARTTRAQIEANCDGASDENQVGIVFRG